MPLAKAKTFTPALALNKYEAGHYFTLPIISTTTGNANVGNLVAYQMYFPTINIDRIGCRVATAGGAGSLARLGIYYASLTACYPGQLLLDAGTVAVDQIGNREITISQSISEGFYWLAYLADTVVGAAPVVRQHSSTMNQFAPITSANTNFQTGSFFRIGSQPAGSLASTFPAGASDIAASGGCHIIYTRIA
jgi:hypothetical protein